MKSAAHIQPPPFPLPPADFSGQPPADPARPGCWRRRGSRTWTPGGGRRPRAPKGQRGPPARRHAPACEQISIMSTASSLIRPTTHLLASVLPVCPSVLSTSALTHCDVPRAQNAADENKYGDSILLAYPLQLSSIVLHLPAYLPIASSFSCPPGSP